MSNEEENWQHKLRGKLHARCDDGFYYYKHKCYLKGVNGSYMQAVKFCAQNDAKIGSYPGCWSPHSNYKCYLYGNVQSDCNEIQCSYCSKPITIYYDGISVLALTEIPNEQCQKRISYYIRDQCRIEK